MSNLANFNYNGQIIQKRESDGYINLTQMCQANGKRIDKYLKSKRTQEYIDSLERSPQMGGSPLDSVKGGDSRELTQGTWGHPLIAIDLARWISADFAVWCDAHIFNLMESGSTSLDTDPIEEMKLKIELAKLETQKENAIAQQKQADYGLTQFRHTIVTTCSEPVQQKILGYQTVKEVQYRDRVLKDDQVLREGDTLNKSQLCHRYGILTKNGSPDYKSLNKIIGDVDLPQDAWKNTYFIKDVHELSEEYVHQLDQILLDRNYRQLECGE